MSATIRNGRDWTEIPHPEAFKMPYESPSEWEKLFWKNRYSNLSNYASSPLWLRFHPESRGRVLYG